MYMYINTYIYIYIYVFFYLSKVCKKFHTHSNHLARTRDKTEFKETLRQNFNHESNYKTTVLEQKTSNPQTASKRTCRIRHDMSQAKLHAPLPSWAPTSFLASTSSALRNCDKALSNLLRGGGVRLQVAWELAAVQDCLVTFSELIQK